MNKLISLTILSTLLLAACGTSIDVADKETIKANPDLKGAIHAWQGLVDAAEDEDCEAFLDNIRKTIGVTEADCPAAFAYFAGGAPIVDWDKTDFNSTGIKAKIYEMDRGSITSFIHDTSSDEWRAETVFWE